MDIEKMISNKEGLKYAVVNNSPEEAHNTLRFLQAILPNGLQKALASNHGEVILLKRQYANHLMDSASYSIAMNKSIDALLHLIDDVFTSIPEEEFAKAFGYISTFEQGKLAYRDKDWTKAKMYFEQCKECYSPAFKNTLFDLNTHIRLCELQIMHANHIRQTAEWPLQIENIQATTAEKFLNSNTFLNHPWHDRIIVDPISFSFPLIVQGDYQVKYLSRWYKTVTVPKHSVLTKPINTGITPETFKLIHLFPEKTVSTKSFTLGELQELHSIRLNDCAHIPPFIMNDKVEDIQCRTCDSKGSVDCTECTDGFKVCYKCKGNKEVKCFKCRGSRNLKCYRCSGKGHRMNGQVAETCKECAGKGNTPCTECNSLGNVMCRNCEGAGRLVCKNCNGDREIQCKDCRGTGGFYTIPYITTDVISFKKDGFFQYNRENNAIDRLPIDVSSKVSAEQNNFTFRTENICTTYRTEGYEVVFEQDDIQKALCEEGRKDTTMSQSNSIILEEKTAYQISPCLTASYVFLHDMDNPSTVYFIQHQDKTCLYFAGEENRDQMKSIPSRSEYKTLRNRAISAKEQLETDDRVVETMLLLYIFKEDAKLSLLEKKVIGPYLSEIFGSLTREMQDMLVKTLNRSHTLTGDQLPLKFSSKAAAIASFERIKKIAREQQLPQVETALEELQVKALEASPERVNYVWNLMYYGKSFLLLALLTMIRKLPMFRSSR